ncbi:MAG: DMP19 family protein [Saprospiraceae bacterium]|nr:DMP19 family protein [Saprospiraceae bacterium]
MKYILLCNDATFPNSLSSYLWEKCEFLEKPERLNAFEFNLLLYDYLEMEVNNGGFHQFYINSSGNYAHETEQALEEIGAIKTLKILKIANSQFPSGQVPKDRGLRMDAVMIIQDRAKIAWDTLENKFYGPNPKTGELEIDSSYILMRNYIEVNIDHFN